MFGNPETTTGGRALKFYASVRIDIRRIAAIKDGDNVTGNRTKVKVVKNKVAAPFRQAEFDIMYGEGISFEGDLVDLGVIEKMIAKSGAWYSYLRDNPEIREKLHQDLRKALGLLPVVRPDGAETSVAEMEAEATNGKVVPNGGKGASRAPARA
jgi:recombination protein RecA